MATIRFIDMFCGIGGFRLGLERAGDMGESRWQGDSPIQREQPDLATEKTRRYFRCVWSNDNDTYACQIYRQRFGNQGSQYATKKSQSPEPSIQQRGKRTPYKGRRECVLSGQQPSGNRSNWDESSGLYEGDIRAVDTSTIPEHDLLCAGFPCQSFSIAGKRRGFEDTRGTLFFEICRVLRAKRPRMLFLENVKGLLSADEGRTFFTIIQSLDELGYDCQWQVLNSKDYGVPQNRERVFIIGHSRNIPRPKVFPIGEADEIYSEPDGQIAHASDSNYHKGWLDNQQRTMILHNIYGGFNEHRPREFRDYSPPIRTPSGGGHLPIVAQRWVRTEKGKEARRKSQKQGRDSTPFNEGHRELILAKENISGCITDALAKDALLGDNNRIRRLTPIECERLQGFPDNWTQGISDSQKYKCLGNAVTTNVITAIGRQLINGLGGSQ